MEDVYERGHGVPLDSAPRESLADALARAPALERPRQTAQQALEGLKRAPFYAQQLEHLETVPAREVRRLAAAASADAAQHEGGPAQVRHRPVAGLCAKLLRAIHAAVGATADRFYLHQVDARSLHARTQVPVA
jgi:hypothetical protein